MLQEAPEPFYFLALRIIMSRQTGARSKVPAKAASLGLRSRDTSNVVFGIGAELPKNQLPKYTDVIKFKYLLQDRYRSLSENQYFSL